MLDDGLWPRHGQEPLSQIVIDYGRSHYFIAGSGADVPKLVHTYIFTNAAKADDEYVNPDLHLISMFLTMLVNV